MLRSNCNAHVLLKHTSLSDATVRTDSDCFLQGMEICDPCTMSVVLAPQRNELMQKMAQLPLHIQAAMAPINTSIATMAEVANSHTPCTSTAPRTVSYTIICHSVLAASSHAGSDMTSGSFRPCNQTQKIVTASRTEPDAEQGHRGGRARSRALPGDNVCTVVLMGTRLGGIVSLVLAVS